MPSGRKYPAVLSTTCGPSSSMPHHTLQNSACAGRTEADSTEAHDAHDLLGLMLAVGQAADWLAGTAGSRKHLVVLCIACRWCVTAADSWAPVSLARRGPPCLPAHQSCEPLAWFRRGAPVMILKLLHAHTLGARACPCCCHSVRSKTRPHQLATVCSRTCRRILQVSQLTLRSAG
jgi:hypothetical protein